MESVIPLRSSKLNKPSDDLNENSTNKKAEATEIAAIRLKGQMKWISSWNLIAFLCHPMYVLFDFDSYEIILE